MVNVAHSYFLLFKTLSFRAQMKQFIREHNTSFKLNDVHRLVVQWMAALDSSTSTSYLQHARQNEDVFKQADNFVEEEIEPQLDEDDDASVSSASSDSEDETDSP